MNFFAIAPLAVCAATGIPHATPDPAAIDTEAQRLMARGDVQGLALAVIEDGEVAYVAAYGHRNVEQDLPLTTDTVMYGASLTKTAFAYMVLQLVDEGRLDLDTPIAELLPRPLPEYDEGDHEFSDLAGDERWRELTPRILLTHSPGFANFRWLEPDKKLRFHFEPGERYAYSGEGYRLLQLVLKEGLGLDVGAEMERRIFDRFGMTDTSMTWRVAFAHDVADGYDQEGSMVPHDKRRTADAAGSMDTTIADQARMWSAILRGEGLSEASRAELVRPQLPITSAHQFPTLRPWTDPRNAEIGLSAGLGLVVLESHRGRVWFKGGHDRGTGNMAVGVEDEGRCVVLLANDVRAERVYPELVEFILGDAGVPWYWEYHF